MDFALILFILLLVTGLIWLLDLLMLAPARGRANAAARGAGDAGSAPIRREPWLVEYAKAFFPVILLVFVIRSFVVEPFRIPSGSMLPNLHIGDFILVNKFVYGVRLPIVNTKVFDVRDPQRGEVMVFRFPRDRNTNFIKRVVGKPGDHLIYEDKQLIINGSPVELNELDRFILQEGMRRRIQAVLFEEHIDGVAHHVVVDETRSAPRLEFNVPEGNYFMMGDNRDHSNDSRFWGFVPEEDIIGRAFFIWFSWDSAGGGGVNWSRIGNSIR